MNNEEIFLMICAIIGGLLVSALITYWCRSLFKHMITNKIFKKECLSSESYTLTFFLMYLPVMNVLYLLALLILFEINNLQNF